MIKRFAAGLLFLPWFVFGAVDPLSIKTDSNGNVQLIDGNYQCSYSGIEQNSTRDEKLKGAEIYIEKGEDDTALFTVSFPGGISINPPIAKKAEQTKDTVTYQSTDDLGNVFFVGLTTKDGVVSALGSKNTILHASTFISDCKLIRNLE